MPLRVAGDEALRYDDLLGPVAEEAGEILVAAIVHGGREVPAALALGGDGPAREQLPRVLPARLYARLRKVGGAEFRRHELAAGEHSGAKLRPNLAHERGAGCEGLELRKDSLDLGERNAQLLCES